MKFGLTHRILTSALATLGVLSIVLSGALQKVPAALLVVGLIASLLATESFQQSTTARYAAAIVPSLVLGVELLRFVSGAPLLELAVEFAAALQIVRLGTRRGATHDQQVVLLSLLHLVAGTVLGGGLAYGVCLFGFLVLAPGALVLSHLRREVEGNYRQGARDRTGLPVDVPRILRSRRVIGPGFLALTCLLSLPIILFTACLFVMFPRVGFSLLLFQSQHPGRITGFSDSVDLSGVGKLRDDPSIVIRFRMGEPSASGQPPQKMILRLRGTAFDEYQGGGKWSRTSGERTLLQRLGSDVPLYQRFPDPARDKSVKIELEPLEPTVVFLPPQAVAVRWTTGADRLSAAPPPLIWSAEGTLRYEAPAERVLRYEVFVAQGTELVGGGVMSDFDRKRYLQLPPEMAKASRMRELALAWTRGAVTPWEKAAQISQHLEREYRYSLDAPSGGKQNPIDDFLFESRAGHCEFFSTAMTMLLRMVDVPARNVTGFVGGTWNRFGGFYAVRQGDAHSWVEVYVGDRQGWATYDPTPAVGAQPVTQQSGALATLREILEAVSQSWDRYVVGYDLPTQMEFFRKVQRAIERRREIQPALPNADGASRGISKTGVAVTVAVIVGAIAGVFLIRRRRRESGTSRAERDARRQRRATRLWLDLEEALQTRGFTRPRHIPPLRFIEQLRATRDDALAEEAWVLVHTYAAARFGGTPLTPEEERLFLAGVQRIRQGRDPSPA